MICLALSLVHIGTIANDAILVAAFLNDSFSGSFWERIYHLGPIPYFALCCVLMFGGLLMFLGARKCANGE